MVKTPSTRHSKSGREPVTIEHAATPAKKGKAKSGGKAFEGAPDGSTATDAAAGQRRPATKVGQTHSVADDFAATPAALEKEALVDTHADSPIMHPELAPAQSSTDMLNADRAVADKPEEPFDEQPGATLPEDETKPAATGNPYDQPDPKPARATQPPRQPVREPVVQRSPGMGRLLGAAVVGGMIALCGYGLLNAIGLFGDRSATEMASLQAEIAELRSGLHSSAGQDVSQQIEQLRGEIASLQQNGAGGSAEVETLTQRVSDLASQLSSAAQGSGDSTEASGRIQALEQRLSGLQQEIGALGERIGAEGNEPRLALAVTASALKAAIDRGDAFQPELDAYSQAAGADRPEVNALRELSMSGVPTRAVIAQELPAAASAMVAAAKPEPTNSGVIARLWSSASDLVEVRPVGADAQGNEPGAVVARLEAAVEAGDYGRALGEYELLPQASKSAGEAFIAKVRARQTADDLVGKALAEALKA